MKCTLVKINTPDRIVYGPISLFNTINVFGIKIHARIIELGYKGILVIVLKSFEVSWVDQEFCLQMDTVDIKI